MNMVLDFKSGFIITSPRGWGYCCGWCHPIFRSPWLTIYIIFQNILYIRFMWSISQTLQHRREKYWSHLSVHLSVVWNEVHPTTCFVHHGFHYKFQYVFLYEGMLNVFIWMKFHSSKFFQCVFNFKILLSISLTRDFDFVIHVQYIPRNMHRVLLCFALLWLCNRS